MTHRGQLQKIYTYLFVFFLSRDALTCSTLCLKDENCQNFAISKITGNCLSVSKECLKEQPNIIKGLTFFRFLLLTYVVFTEKYSYKLCSWRSKWSQNITLVFRMPNQVAYVHLLYLTPRLLNLH